MSKQRSVWRRTCRASRSCVPGCAAGSSARWAMSSASHDSSKRRIGKCGERIVSRVVRSMATMAEALARAVQGYMSGNLAGAEQICQQVLEANPAQADALNLLGLVAQRAGQP